MEVAQLYINENYIELSKESAIALTFQINNISNLQNRQGFFSNTLKAPLTKSNVANLGHISNVNSGSNIPYEKNTAKIVQGGIEIVNDGVAEISTVNGSFSINVYSGNLDFFSLIGSSTLPELPFGSIEDIGEWDYDNILASQANDFTDGFTYGLIDWGNASHALENALYVRSDRIYPLYFVAFLMDKIAESVDYTLAGSLIDSDQYEKLLLSIDKWGHTEDFLTEHTCSSTQVGDTGFTAHTVTEDVDNFFTIPANTSSGSEASSSACQFTPTIDITATVEININLDLFLLVVASFSDYSFNLQLYNVTTATDIAVNASVTGAANVTDTLLFTGRFTAGNTYRARINIQNGIYTSNIDIDYNSGCNMTVTPISYIGVGDTVYSADVLPDMKQVDFIKGICNMTSSVFTTDSIRRVVSFNFMDDVLGNIGNAIDWSDKIHLGNVPVLNFRNNNYGQSNLFKYKEDDTVLDGYGDGQILISDENLDAEKTLVVLPFAATEHYINLNGYPVPNIKFRNSLSSYERINPRIFMSDPQTGTSISLVNEANSSVITPYTTTPYCYFINNNKSDSLGFNQDLIENYYQVVQTVMNQYKEIDAFFKLTELDIANLNFLYPIYLDVNTPEFQINGYFYINRIENYKGTGFTKCKLIRL